MHFMNEYFVFARILHFHWVMHECILILSTLNLPESCSFNESCARAFYLWVFYICQNLTIPAILQVCVLFMSIFYLCQSFTSQVSCMTTVHLPKCCIFGESCMITLYLPEYITFSIFHLCRCLVSTERTIVVRRWDSKHAWLKTFLVWGDISSREVTMCLCVWYLCDRLRWMRGSL